MSLLSEIKVTRWENDEDRLDQAVDSITLSVQFALQKAMREQCLTQKELAARLNVSAARISQILAKNAENLTLKTIARIADALGEDFELVSRRDLNELKKKRKVSTTKADSNVLYLAGFRTNSGWVDTSVANDVYHSKHSYEEVAVAVGQ